MELTPEAGDCGYYFLPMLTKLFDKLRSNESSTTNYYDFHDYPFVVNHRFVTRCWLSVAFRHVYQQPHDPAPANPASRRLLHMVIPLCHSWRRTSDSVLVAPNSDRQKGKRARSFIGSGFAGMKPTGEPLSLPIRLGVSIRRIQSNYRLPLGRAQGGAFSGRSRKVPQPACAHARTARAPHLYLSAITG